MEENLTLMTSPTTIFANTYNTNENYDGSMDDGSLVTLSLLLRRNEEHRNSDVVRMIQVIARPPHHYIRNDWKLVDVFHNAERFTERTINLFLHGHSGISGHRWGFYIFKLKK